MLFQQINCVTNPLFSRFHDNSKYFLTNFHSVRVSNIKRLNAQRGCWQYSYGLILFLGIRTKYSRPLVIIYIVYASILCILRINLMTA